MEKNEEVKIYTQYYLARLMRAGQMDICADTRK
jgi:hypothetical protein